MKRSSAPGFLDAIIVVLVSAATVIFLLWATARTMGIDTFEHLPDWLEKAYNAVWASVVAGTAGIGLAIVKMLRKKPEDAQPNYLMLMGLTTVLMIVLIFLMPSLFAHRTTNVKDYIETEVKDGGFVPPNIGPQRPGCACGPNGVGGVITSPPHVRGKLGDWLSFTWDAHWLCQGQAVKNPEASIQWDGHYTDSLPSWAGTAKVKYAHPGSYLVALKASGNCIDSNNGGAECWPNGNYCAASGTATIDVVP